MNMNSNQMQLGLKARQGRGGARQKQRRQERAQWWFAQMRAAVASAMDWPANGQSRPEQILFPGANREVRL